MTNEFREKPCSVPTCARPRFRDYRFCRQHLFAHTADMTRKGYLTFVPRTKHIKAMLADPKVDPMKKFMYSTITIAVLACLCLVPSPTTAQDPAPNPAPAPAPAPAKTAADVIKAREAAKATLDTAAAAVTAAQTALQNAQQAAVDAQTASANADAALISALQSVGPVVVIGGDGTVTVYEILADGSLRVLAPKPADSVTVPDNPPPLNASVRRPAPSTQRAMWRPSK